MGYKIYFTKICTGIKLITEKIYKDENKKEIVTV